MLETNFLVMRLTPVTGWAAIASGQQEAAMHLVFATSIVPSGSATTGYEIANAAIVDALRRAGVKVTVLGFIWPGASPSDPEHTVVLGEVHGLEQEGDEANVVALEVTDVESRVQRPVVLDDVVNLTQRSVSPDHNSGCLRFGFSVTAADA